MIIAFSRNIYFLFIYSILRTLVLSTICEDFLRCLILHVDLIVNKLCDGFLSCLGNGFCNGSTRGIIDCCDDPSIPIISLGQSSDQIYSPSLKWLNKGIRHQLCVFSFLCYTLTLMNLTIWTHCNELTKIFLHAGPPRS